MDSSDVKTHPPLAPLWTSLQERRTCHTVHHEREGGGESTEPSVGADQDKINGSDRECRRQQEIQSRPINNILVRQQLPPVHLPPPHSTPDPPGPPLEGPH